MTTAALRFDAGHAAARDPRFEIRAGVSLAALFTVGFLGWAAVARLDAAVHMPGVVRVDGDRLTVQSAAGGIVSALHVREGDRVAAGQPLVDFADTEALAQERSLASRVIGLQAEIARITADQSGASRVAPPPDWASLTGEERDEAARALASEQANLAAKRSLAAEERAVLGQRLVQAGDQIAGHRERQASNLRQKELNDSELGDIQSLYHKGFATRTRVLALQRSAASVDGDVGATRAEIARLQTSAGEIRMQMVSMAGQREHDNSERLRLARTELDTLLPQWRAAREQLARSQVQAPASGTVIDLAANSVGGVIAPGKSIMDIVPDHRAFQIETRISPEEAAELRPGQRADVRAGGAAGRRLPPVSGRVEQVSADSRVDDRTGRSFFTAVVTVPPQALTRFARASGSEAMRSGTPVEVTVPLRARSALGYLLDPLASRWRSGLSEP